MAKTVDPYQVHSPDFIARVKWTLGQLPANGTFLDVGIGDGWLTSLIEKRGLDVIGVDAEPKHALFWKPEKADAHKLPFKAKSFDYVGCFECLEHVEWPAKVATELMRVAKKGVFVTVPMQGRVKSPGHRHVYFGRGLRLLFPNATIIEMPVGSPHKWYWCEVKK
jgi:ubiquinone/menaquinone biosynthesis C-methylase UbiE